MKYLLIIALLISTASQVRAEYCLADFNKDTVTDSKDIAYITKNWGLNVYANPLLATYDLDGNGWIGIGDMSYMLISQNWYCVGSHPIIGPTIWTSGFTYKEYIQGSGEIWAEFRITWQGGVNTAYHLQRSTTPEFDHRFTQEWLIGRPSSYLQQIKIPGPVIYYYRLKDHYDNEWGNTLTLHLGAELVADVPVLSIDGDITYTNTPNGTVADYTVSWHAEYSESDDEYELESSLLPHVISPREVTVVRVTGNQFIDRVWLNSDPVYYRVRNMTKSDWWPADSNGWSNTKLGPSPHLKTQEKEYSWKTQEKEYYKK